MFVLNSEHFNTITVPKFIGSKIVKYCPMLSIASNGDYVFLNKELIKQNMIKFPFYVRAYLKRFGF